MKKRRFAEVLHLKKEPKHPPVVYYRWFETDPATGVEIQPTLYLKVDSGPWVCASRVKEMLEKLLKE